MRHSRSATRCAMANMAAHVDYRRQRDRSRSRCLHFCAATRSNPEEKAMRKGTTIAVAVGIVAALLSSVATADPIADFYRGKTLRMLIGYGPGGGYDLYGRLVAELLPRHIPGNPIIVPQNMQGGGSFVEAKFMQEVEHKDGNGFVSVA